MNEDEMYDDEGKKELKRLTKINELLVMGLAGDERLLKRCKEMILELGGNNSEIMKKLSKMSEKKIIELGIHLAFKESEFITLYLANNKKTTKQIISK